MNGNLIEVLKGLHLVQLEKSDSISDRISRRIVRVNKTVELLKKIHDLFSSNLYVPKKLWDCSLYSRPASWMICYESKGASYATQLKEHFKKKMDCVTLRDASEGNILHVDSNNTCVVLIFVQEHDQDKKFSAFVHDLFVNKDKYDSVIPVFFRDHTPRKGSAHHMSTLLGIIAPRNRMTKNYLYELLIRCLQLKLSTSQMNLQDSKKSYTFFL